MVIKRILKSFANWISFSFPGCPVSCRGISFSQARSCCSRLGRCCHVGKGYSGWWRTRWKPRLTTCWLILVCEETVILILHCVFSFNILTLACGMDVVIWPYVFFFKIFPWMHDEWKLAWYEWVHPLFNVPAGGAVFMICDTRGSESMPSAFRCNF